MSRVIPRLPCLSWRGTLLLLTLLAAMLAGPIAPAVAQTEPTNRATLANAGTVGIVTGGIDGTYARIAADLAAVLDDGDRLRVLPVLGKGSVQNLADILFLHGIDVGIVQSDTLAYVQQQHLFPGLEQSIQYITKLYQEEVHILARNDITSLEDLAGKPVAVDGRGSGTAMTASLLFGAVGVRPAFTNDDPQVALERLQRGEIAAMVYVVGTPARLFARIAADSNLHFVPIPLIAALAENYLPTRLSHAQYPDLIAEAAPVDTVAVGAVMAVFAWQPTSERYRKVARFIDAFFGGFQQFLQPPRHPKWREVNLAAQVPGWKRFPAAQEWLQRSSTLASSGYPSRP
jgi:TRAP transporter TAXI family solute receptor